MSQGNKGHCVKGTVINFAMIDVIDEGDDTTLGKEQDIFDEHDD